MRNITTLTLTGAGCPLTAKLLNNSVVYACSPGNGTFLISPLPSCAVICSVGSQRNFTGATVTTASRVVPCCLRCPAGFYCDAFSADGTTTPCPAGKYNLLTGQNSASDCDDCPVGRYSLAGAAACTVCPAGKTTRLPSPRTGLSSCDGTCGPDTYTAFINGTAATSAVPSTVPPTDGLPYRDCLWCPTGTYNRFSGQQACCPPGTYYLNASANFAVPVGGASFAQPCSNCTAGRWMNSSNVTNVGGNIPNAVCSPCGLDTHSAAVGAFYASLNATDTPCAPCANGSFAPEGSGVCCALGAYASGVNCLKCAAGRFADAALLPPATRRASGPSDCSRCPPGTWSSALGADSAAACNRCPSGTFSVSSGATSLAVCLPCANGTFSPPGATSCTPCPKNTFSYRNSSECTPCAANTFSIGGGSLCCPLG